MLVKLLVLGLLLLAAWWAWRQWLRSHRVRYINTARLPASLRAQLRQLQPGWSEAQTQRVEEGLRQYFRLCAAQPGRFIAMPSKAVDLAWHAFILDTRAYARWCDHAFGRFLHHRPAEALPPGEARPRLLLGLRHAWFGACHEEGISPSQPTRLPLLFALDAELGLAGGYHYVPDCRLLGADRGDTHCAVALGCGGDGDSSSSSSSNHDGGSDGDGGGGCGGGD